MKFWPYGSSSKEILFLNELDDLFEHIESAELAAAPVCQKIYKRLGQCIGGKHFQVTERTLWLFNNATIIHLFVEDPTHRSVRFVTNDITLLFLVLMCNIYVRILFWESNAELNFSVCFY